MNSLDKLINLQPVYKQKAQLFPKKRFLFDCLLNTEAKTKLISGISGLRGSGKTVLLLQLLNHLSNSFYISLDTLENNQLFELVSTLKDNYNIQYFLLDEIHYLPDWSRQLKQIYDILNVKIIFTSSVSLDILETREDLARRVNIINLPILSFREFILFKYHRHLPLLSLNKILTTKSFKPHLDLAAYFLNYLKYPLAAQLKEHNPQILKNIIERIINYDLANIKSLTLNDRLKLKQTLNFLANIKGGDISITSLAKNIGVTKYKMESYTNLLEKTFLIHRVEPFGTNVLREPKILLNLPLRIYLPTMKPTANVLGTLKEDFFITMIKAVNQKVTYLKAGRGKKTPDFLISLKSSPYIIEIGGKRKGFSQFKGTKIKEKKIAIYPFAPKPNAIPLYLFGMIY